MLICDTIDINHLFLHQSTSTSSSNNGDRQVSAPITAVHCANMSPNKLFCKDWKIDLVQQLLLWFMKRIENLIWHFCSSSSNPILVFGIGYSPTDLQQILVFIIFVSGIWYLVIQYLILDILQQIYNRFWYFGICYFSMRCLVFGNTIFNLCYSPTDFSILVLFLYRIFGDTMFAIGFHSKCPGGCVIENTIAAKCKKDLKMWKSAQI